MAHRQVTFFDEPGHRLAMEAINHIEDVWPQVWPGQSPKSFVKRVEDAMRTWHPDDWAELAMRAGLDFTVPDDDIAIAKRLVLEHYAQQAGRAL